MRVSKVAKVHGMLTALSAKKSSSSGSGKYFDSQLTDGERLSRFVGFDLKVQQKLSDFLERKEPVVMTNCEVKVGKYTSDLEVVVRNSSEFQKSPKKFDADDVNKFMRHDEVVMLSELSRLSNFQKVCVKVKVICERDVEEVKNGLIKQEYVIAVWPSIPRTLK